MAKHDFNKEMIPQRGATIGQHNVEEFFCGGRTLVFVDGEKIDASFEDAIAGLEKANEAAFNAEDAARY